MGKKQTNGDLEELKKWSKEVKEELKKPEVIDVFLDPDTGIIQIGDQSYQLKSLIDKQKLRFSGAGSLLK